MIKFQALIKKFTSKALASGDKGYEVVIQGEDSNMKQLADAPADSLVEISIDLTKRQ